MGQMKIFTLNDKVALNEEGAQITPEYQGRPGTVVGYYAEDNVYVVEFENGQRADFLGDELDYHIESSADYDYEGKARNVGKLVHEKQIAYGNSVDASFQVMKAFLARYRLSDGSYKIPESLLQHILLQVRIVDKQNRIFTNPNGDLMDESPYTDILGYALLGQKMVDIKN